MGLPANKTELQFAVQTNCDKLQKEILSISVYRTTEKELEGHAKNTLMSVNDLVAYLLGWGEIATELD